MRALAAILELELRMLLRKLLPSLFGLAFGGLLALTILVVALFAVAERIPLVGLVGGPEGIEALSAEIGVVVEAAAPDDPGDRVWVVAPADPVREPWEVRAADPVFGDRAVSAVEAAQAALRTAAALTPEQVESLWGGQDPLDQAESDQVLDFLRRFFLALGVGYVAGMGWFSGHKITALREQGLLRLLRLGVPPYVLGAVAALYDLPLLLFLLLLATPFLMTGSALTLQVALALPLGLGLGLAEGSVFRLGDPKGGATGLLICLAGAAGAAAAPVWMRAFLVWVPLLGLAIPLTGTGPLGVHVAAAAIALLVGYRSFAAPEPTVTGLARALRRLR
ncbi:MAG: hypothetical protein H6736_10625 [Alphaproteobacteria bacterium]|nr:hypothetical protein [Alphaproteobacteria bacterium]